MKKKLFLLIFIVLFGMALIVCGEVNATTYSGQEYQIDIPDDIYNVEILSDGIEAQSKDQTKMIGLSVSEDNSNIICDEVFLEYLISAFESQYGSDFKLISSKVVKSNQCIGTQLQYRESSSGIYIYVDMYTFKSDNYLYNLGFLSFDKSYLTSTEKEKIYNSFKIKDTVSSSNGIPFTDVASSDWYYDAVEYVYNNNMIKGTNAYTFAPNKKLTRGMLVTILWRMEGEPTVTNARNFPDVKSGEYYYKATRWAVSKGIVSGYNSGNFGPNDDITREQLAVILRKYANYKGKDVSAKASLSSYKDGSKVSSYAKESMQWAIKTKVMSGKDKGTRLDPQGSASRAEAAGMLSNYCKNIGR